MNPIPNAWDTSYTEPYSSLESVISKCLCATAPYIVFDVSAGEQICQNCGVVISVNVVDYTSTSSSSSYLPTSQPRTNARYKSLMQRLYTILDQIHATSAIRTHSFHICNKIIKNNLYKGCKRHSLIVALVMISCKLHGKILNPDDIVEKTSEKTINKLYRTILVDFKITLDSSTYIKSIITKMCTDLNLHQTTLKKALEYSDILIHDTRASGVNPKCLGGYCVYRASDKEITLKKVAYASSISVSCISRVKHIGL